MASTYLTRSLSSTSTSWTFSAWVKRSGISATNYLISWGNSGTDATGIGFNADDTFQYYSESSPDNKNRKTSAKYRDTNAWYHLVVKSDANALTLYVNGEEPTQSWVSGSSANPLDTSTMAIGKWVTSAYYHNGSMSHIHFIDGTAYDATAFGEYDANGVWKIKTDVSVTYGSNGYFILKDGNSVTDQSGNSNNFTVGGGTLTNTEDSPSNVFATLNPLALPGQTSSFSNGNTKAQTATAVASNQVSTLAASSGKYYWEIKCDAISSDEDPFIFGIMEVQSYPTSRFSVLSTGYGYKGFTGQKVNTNVSSSYGDAYAVGDIISVAVDLDNNKIYFAKNGTWQNSGDPTSGATGTGAAFTISDGTYFAAQCCEGNTRNVTYSTNFGNGYFGTTAVSSAGTNASGNGIFEYDVPTGYTALSTKGLNL